MCSPVVIVTHPRDVKIMAVTIGIGLDLGGNRSIFRPCI